MDYYYNLKILGWLAGSVEIALAITVLFKISITRIKVSFFACAVISAVWHISLPISPEFSVVTSWQFLFMEGLRYLAWLLILVHLLMLSRGTKLPVTWALNLYLSLTLLLLLLAYTLSSGFITSPPTNFWLYIQILFCLFDIIICEQLLRHDHSSRMAKLVALIAFTIFAYDIFAFSNILLFSNENSDIWYARGFISTATALTLALSVIFYAPQLQERSQFKLSNSVILFNTSLTLVGAFLVLISLFGSILNFFDISWINATTIMLYVMAIFIIIALSFSENIRQQIVVFTSKHFFAHKYDYKKQWTKLDALLSDKNSGANCYDKSLKSISNLFSCSSGGIWIKGQQFYTLVATKDLNFPSEHPMESNASEFIRILATRDWIFQLCKHTNAVDNQYNAQLPGWLLDINKHWIVVPLNTDEQLIGFAVLCKDSFSNRLTWEDLDLLKLTGGQIASYISHQQTSEQLHHNKQFDMFNKLTAFAIHDVKNLIAQQALVVKNAEKYKHHPEFIDDAIDTIANSVNKMDKLLAKLQGKSLGTDEHISINQLLTEAIEMNANTQPIPSVIVNGPNAHINADKDKLLMALNHLIKNAQDATANTGSIDIKLNTNDSAIWLEVKDNGIGMDQSFINNQLFKPFSSTKQSKGMGLGAYQIRELIHSLQGELLVESTPNVGSKFSIYLPITSSVNL
ncbi:MAG: putative PEP-CTERM system histidine kinase [Moritella sp.]|jgi:putative PEP-CTERM system histidine kinase